MQFQVVSIVTRRSYFTGSGDECQDWLASYGGGWSQFEVLPYSKDRIEGDISETY